MSNDPFTPPFSDTPVFTPEKEPTEISMVNYIIKAILVIAFAGSLGWLIAHILGLSWGWIRIEC